jgi:hypothetical protein
MSSDDDDRVMVDVHKVFPPKGVEVARWALTEVDVARDPPEPIPRGWPESTRMCLLVVHREHGDFGQDCQTIGYMIASDAAMRLMVNRCMERPQLWFRMPRAAFTPEICPTLHRPQPGGGRSDEQGQPDDRARG